MAEPVRWAQHIKLLLPKITDCHEGQDSTQSGRLTYLNCLDKLL